jgi:hypothetical protein
VERNVLRNLDNVRAVRSRAIKSIPEYPGVQLLVAVLATAAKQDQAAA